MFPFVLLLLLFIFFMYVLMFWEVIQVQTVPSYIEIKQIVF